MNRSGSVARPAATHVRPSMTPFTKRRRNDVREAAVFIRWPPRDVRHTSQRAPAFTISVTMKSTKPTAMSADRCRSLVASVNWLAMSEAMV